MQHMNPSITDLKWSGPALSWKAAGMPQTLVLPSNVDHALTLHSEGIALVLAGKNWDDRALIINTDGSVRTELKNPFPPEAGKGFYYFHYQLGQLIVVLAGTTGDFSCTVDETTGALSEPRETR